MADQRLNIIFSGDGSQLNKTISQLENQLKRFEAGLKTASGAESFNRLNRAIEATKQRLDILRSGSLAAGQALTKVTAGTQSATFALVNAGRVIQDLPFGFIGIANNLNPLLESFQRLRKEAGSTSSALKLLGSSLLGAGGLGFALSTVSTLFIVFGNKLTGSSKSITKTANEVKSAIEIIGDATGNVQGEIARINALVSVATSATSSFDQQKRALSELKNISNEYFGNLTAGVSSFENIKIAADNYTQSLVNQSIVKGLESAISDLSKELGTAMIAYQDATKRANEARIALQKIKNETATVAQGMTGQNREVNVAANAYNNLQAKVLKAGTEVGKINTRIKEFQELLKTEIIKSFKIPAPDSSEFKDETDKIIERARLFVKEFGDVFVLPDLEESFFTNKSDLLKSSKKLLSDVDSFLKGNTGALKIKIPVLPEIDALPIQENIISKEIENTFFKNIEREREIPINIIPDISLSKNNLDQIDKKLKLFGEFFSRFGELGIREFNKIDFSNIEKGIERATIRLQEMNEIASTIAQSIGQNIANAFERVFDAILEGKNVFKVLGEAVKDLVVQTIKAVVQMLILRSITKTLTGGIGIPIPLPGGVAGGTANLSFGGAIGSRAAQTLSATVRGTDLVFVLTQGQRITGG